MNEVSGYKDTIVVCNDIYGLDVYMIIMAINERARKIGNTAYNVVGFICDETNIFENITTPAPVLGKISDWKIRESELYIMAIRKPEVKKKVALLLKERGACFESLIAPWVLLPSEYYVGEGSIIANYSCKYKSKFGDFVIADNVMCESVEVGDYSTLCPFSNITNATIGQEVYIGAHAVVMEHKKIGDKTVVLPGSIVLTNTKPGTIVAGVPATSRNLDKWNSLTF